MGNDFTEVLIYIKPHILKGLNFHVKKIEFILQVVENWKIFEIREGHHEPICDLGRKSYDAKLNWIARN